MIRESASLMRWSSRSRTQKRRENPLLIPTI